MAQPTLSPIGGTRTAASCNSAGPQLPDVQTTIEDVPATTNVLMAVGDQQGLYWIEADGSVLGLQMGSAASVTLRPAGDPSTVFSGMLADASRVDWVEAPGSMGFYSNPSGESTISIFSVPKLGGSVETLGNSNELLYPLGIAGTDVVVATREGQLQAVEAGELRVLDHIRSSTPPQIVEGDVYWLGQGAGQNRIDVFSATVAPGAVRRRTSFEGSIPPMGMSSGARTELMNPPSYLIGPGFVLWSELLLNDGKETAALRYVDLESGCTRELATADEVRPPLLRDGNYVYWLSADPALVFQTSPTLMRLNLESLALQRVFIPGFDVPPIAELIAQDGRSLYLRNNGSGPLQAILKPQ